MESIHERTKAGHRLGLRLAFTAAIAATFGALLAYAALAPQAMAEPAFAGIPMSLALASAVIACAIGSTGLYVLLADRRAS